MKTEWRKIKKDFHCECGNKLDIVDIAEAKLIKDKEYITCKCGKIFNINELYEEEEKK
jgi:hypothetical protein